MPRALALADIPARDGATREASIAVVAASAMAPRRASLTIDPLTVFAAYC